MFVRTLAVTLGALLSVGNFGPDLGTASAAPQPAPPPVSPQAAAAGLIDVRTVVPDAVIDLRYATPNNFVGVPLYPADARCLIHESMAAGLATAARILRAHGEVLTFWDCYRPHEVQVRMFQAVPDPNWVAKPSKFARSHESGLSVDVTITGVDEDCNGQTGKVTLAADASEVASLEEATDTVDVAGAVPGPVDSSHTFTLADPVDAELVGYVAVVISG